MDVRSVQEKLSGVVLSQLERKIREARTPQEIHEVLVADQETHGTYTRHRDGSFTFDDAPAHQIKIVAKPKETDEPIHVPFPYHSENGFLVPNVVEDTK